MNAKLLIPQICNQFLKHFGIQNCNLFQMHNRVTKCLSIRYLGFSRKTKNFLLNFLKLVEGQIELHFETIKSKLDKFVYSNNGFIDCSCLATLHFVFFIMSLDVVCNRNQTTVVVHSQVHNRLCIRCYGSLGMHTWLYNSCTTIP